jgi:glycosyltransferase involved in cell wall biosynthesis
MKLAILSPNKNAYSETFIQAHKHYLDGEICFYYGENNFLEGNTIGSRKKGLIGKVYERLSASLCGLQLDEYRLYSSFKKNKIEKVLAEYGISGVKVMHVCKKLNLPLIVHFHGYDAYMDNVVATYADAYLELFNTAYKVIAVSKNMVDQLQKLGCPEHKIVYGVYGPEIIFFENERAPKRNMFLSIGRFVDKKAPYYLILTFQKVLEADPDATLVIAGDGPLYETCKNMVSAMRLEDKIFLPGVIKPEQYRAYLKNATAYIQHSIRSRNGDAEGTPVAILEAMAAGVPVVSTKHMGIDDVVVDVETGFVVEEHHVFEMSDKMIQLIQNPDWVIEMGKKGRTRIANHFSMQKHIDTLNAIIKQAR